MTSTNTLAELKALRQRLRKALEAHPLYVELEEIDQTVKRIEARQANIPALATERPPPPPQKYRHEGKTQVEYALQALSKVGHPLSTPELIPEMQKLGCKLKGKHILQNLRQHLSKSKDHLQSVPWRNSKGWWPKGKPLPYQPNGLESEAAGAATND